MPTPNLYLNSKEDVYGKLSTELKGTQVPLYYMTDRKPEHDDKGNLEYGYDRSPSMGFGKATVELGENLTWEDLLEASRTQQRLKPVKLELLDIKELVRGPDTPLPYKMVNGRIVKEPVFEKQREKALKAYRQVIAAHLKQTPRKEVFLFVHGYHNSFEDAAFAMAELWHFMGRIGIPIVYSWPAGHPGLFGYTYDRESSEFTVNHLRRALRSLASMPEVKKIHVIAHSRGTDVAVSALRELSIAEYAAGRDPKKTLKIDNFVIAAPDLDLQVAQQRISSDQLPSSVNRFTIYTSPNDKAIGIAAKLFASPRGRVGTFGTEEMTKWLGNKLTYSNANFSVVNFSGVDEASKSSGDRYGHSYFRDAPTVSSDLILMMRDDLDPGTAGRPLENIGPKIWRIPENYPVTRPSDDK